MQSSITLNTITRSRVRTTLLAIVPLLIIVWFGVQVRLTMLPKMGYRWDSYSFEEWTARVLKGGLFKVYVEPGQDEGLAVNHPPIGVALLALSRQLVKNDGGIIVVPDGTHAVDVNPDYVKLLKYPILVFDVLMIIAGYIIGWIEAKSHKWVWATLVGAALAFNPAILMDGIWWGQTDVIFCLFLVLTIYALQRRLIPLAWVCYALALLVKFQAAPLFPLLLVLSFRREGLRKLLTGMAAAAAVAAIVLTPFVIGSGLTQTLRPYVGTVGQYPFVTVKAHNFWFWTLAPVRNMDVEWHNMPLDNSSRPDGIFWGPISSRMVGYVLFGLCVLIVMRAAWVRPDRDDEYLLATVLHAGFFMFSTQMQTRYLFPALIMATFATINRRWMWAIWAGFTVTITYNTLLLASHDAPLWNVIAGVLTYPQFVNALLNVTMMGILLAVVVFADRNGSRSSALNHISGNAVLSS